MRNEDAEINENCNTTTHGAEHKGFAKIGLSHACQRCARIFSAAACHFAGSANVLIIIDGEVWRAKALQEPC
jgi:hypothetical protein